MRMHRSTRAHNWRRSATFNWNPRCAGKLFYPPRYYFDVDVYKRQNSFASSQRNDTFRNTIRGSRRTESQSWTIVACVTFDCNPDCTNRIAICIHARTPVFTLVISFARAISPRVYAHASLAYTRIFACARVLTLPDRDQLGSHLSRSEKFEITDSVKSAVAGSSIVGNDNKEPSLKLHLAIKGIPSARIIIFIVRTIGERRGYFQPREWIIHDPPRRSISLRLQLSEDYSTSIRNFGSNDLSISRGWNGHATSARKRRRNAVKSEEGGWR